MATDNTPTILVPITRGANASFDIEAFLKDAEKLAREYANQDKAATQAIVEVTQKILTDEKHKKVQSFTAGALAKMALGLMGEIPTDKLCAEAEVRVKSYLSGQPDQFLHITRGRNSGFHVKNRYKADDLAKLVKEKAAADAAAAKLAAANTEEAAAE